MHTTLSIMIGCLLVQLVAHSQALPNPFQIVHALCDQPPANLNVQRIADNDAFPSRTKFPEFCVLPNPVHRLGHQICCNCFAVAHPKFCKPDSWPLGAVNVTNFEQVYDIRNQKKIFNIAGNDYTLMFQFCCDKAWLDTRPSDEAKLWTQPRLDVWKLINDPKYTFKPKSSEFDPKRVDSPVVDTVNNCTDYQEEPCKMGRDAGACTNEEFANLCKRTCQLCVPKDDGPTPPRVGGTKTDRQLTGECARGQIPSNICDKSNANSRKLRWYYDDHHHDCLAFYDNGCVEDNSLGNRYDSYSQCSGRCMPSDAPICAANKPATVDKRTGESIICESNRQTGKDSCPNGSVCMRGAFFSVCCDKKNEDAYAESYRAVCSNGRVHVTFVDRELVRPLLGATCDEQLAFCPDNSQCVKSAKYAHCCKL